MNGVTGSMLLNTVSKSLQNFKRTNMTNMTVATEVKVVN